MLTKEQVFEAAKQGLSDVGATDHNEAEHFTAMYMRVRALEPAPDEPQTEMPVVMIGASVQSMRPLLPEMTVAELMLQLKADIPDFEPPTG